MGTDFYNIATVFCIPVCIAYLKRLYSTWLMVSIHF
eukprot:jgi/Antlo1/1708/1565